MDGTVYIIAGTIISEIYIKHQHCHRVNYERRAKLSGSQFYQECIALFIYVSNITTIILLDVNKRC